MSEILLFIALALLVAVVAMQVYILLRKNDSKPIEMALQRTEIVVRGELASGREETATAAQRLRDELSTALRALNESFQKQLWQLVQATERRFERTRLTIDRNLQLIREESSKSLEQTRDETSSMVKVLRDDSVDMAKDLREESTAGSKMLREEISIALNTAHESLVTTIGEMSRLQNQQLIALINGIDKIAAGNDRQFASLRSSLEQKLVSPGMKAAEMPTIVTPAANAQPHIVSIVPPDESPAAVEKTRATKPPAIPRKSSSQPGIAKKNGKPTPQTSPIELADSHLPPQA